MYRTASLAAGVACALLAGAGCLYYEEPDDPFARAMRDAAAAERGVVRRGRRAPWFLVRIWVGDVAADAPVPEGPVPDADARLPSSLPAQRERAREAGLRVALSLPPEEPHASILLREGQVGFAAIARGVPVAGFEEAGSTVGGAKVDIGFAVIVSGDVGRWTAVELVPAFRDARPGGDEQRVARLAFGAGVVEGEALVVDAAPGAADRVVRALFHDGGAPGRRRRLYVQVAPFR
ncbi:MAG: hypothetical protein ACYTKD_13920 [Planctomycetota bacterium]